MDKDKVIKLLRGIWFTNEEDTIKLAQENGFDTSAYENFNTSYDDLMLDIYQFLSKKATEELTQDE